jgi:heat shock protein HslJ
MFVEGPMRARYRVMGVVAAVIVLGSVGALAFQNQRGGTTPKPVPLRETTWTLIELNGKAIAADVTSKPPILRLERLGNYTGFAGCNQFRGTFTQEGSSLVFSGALATRMACPALADVETPYLGAIGVTRTYRIVENKTLELVDEQGRAVARLEVRPAKSDAGKMP